LKRALVDIVERMAGVRILRDRQVGIAFEEVHLRRLLSAYHVDCVFDVGANAGQYADMLRRRAKYRGTIVSFEPVPEMVRRLRAKASDDPQWHCEELALDLEEGVQTLQVAAEPEFSSLLKPINPEGMFSEEIRTVQSLAVQTSTVARQFDTYQSKLGFRSPFLKVDTQGNDRRVIEGAGDRISEFVGLQSELSVEKIYEGSVGYMETLAYLADIGFELSALVPNNGGHFPKLMEIDCIMINRRLLNSNSNA
jgi:FkbM family methyltransferase